MTASMIPRLVERNAGLGTSITALSEISTVTPGEQDGLAGGVHRHRGRLRRRQPRAEERAAEAVHDEQRVVDAEREREHQREVHRPDRDRHAPACRGTATRRPRPDRPSSASAAARPRPASRTRAAGSASVTGHEITSDFSIAERFAALKSDHIAGAPVRFTSHAGGCQRARACPSGDRRPGPSRSSRARRRPARSRCARRGRSTRRRSAATTVLTAPVGAQRALDAGDRAPGTAGRSTVLRGRADHGHQAVAGEAVEVALDQLPCLHRLRAGALPTGAGQGGLDARREEPEDDRDQQPRDQHDAEVGRGVAAESADRTEGPGVCRMGVACRQRRRHAFPKPS